MTYNVKIKKDLILVIINFKKVRTNTNVSMQKNKEHKANYMKSPSTAVVYVSQVRKKHEILGRKISSNR